MTATEIPTKEPGPNLWLSLFIFIVGAVLASVGVILLFNRLLGVVTEDAFDTPGSEVRVLDPGSYDVYVDAGGIFNTSFIPTAELDDVTVTNVDTGEAVNVSPTGIDLNIGRGQTNFLGIASFEVDTTASYEVDIASGEPGLGLVVESFPNSFSEVQTPVIMTAGGAIILLIGGAMTVIGIVRRSKVKRDEKRLQQAQQGVVPGQFQVPPQYVQGAPVPAPPPQAPGPPPQAPGPPPQAPPATAPPAPPPKTGPPPDQATPWDT